MMKLEILVLNAKLLRLDFGRKVGVVKRRRFG